MAAITPENIGESLKRLRIADYYTSLLHVSGADLSVLPNNDVYTGSGKTTGISLSSINDRVVINRYIEPVGFDTPTEWLDAFFPINSIMLTMTNDNPTNRIAGTKWAPVASGRFLVGVGEGQDRNEPPYNRLFTPGYNGVGSGDIAGEYCTRLRAEELPEHTHDVNTQFTTTGEFDTSTQFIFYFGPTVNEQGITEERPLSDVPGARVPIALQGNFPYYLEQDRIEAFQNNGTYDGQDQYRTWLIQKRHEEGYRYKDEDFNPKLSNHSLAGWGGSVVGGPGWGGLISIGSDELVYINNSPRPDGVPFTAGDTTLELLPSNFDPRAGNRVHPGEFNSQNLLMARNIIVQALGEEAAAEALADVTRLDALDEQVQNGIFRGNTTAEQMPGSGVERITSTTGQTECHNNILPNYGVYVWRRVPLDYQIPEPPEIETNEPVDEPVEPEDTPTPQMWRYTISSNKKELNLNSWARGQGWNGTDPATITIAGGVYIWSDRTDKAALTIDAWPSGVTIINNGFIIGRGGDGGSWVTAKKKRLWPDRDNGQSQDGGYMTGWDGGHAIEIRSTSRVTINNNNGAIGGGGGGGAGGGTGNFGGGGGGAGGGKGGAGSQGVSAWGDSREKGGCGGNLGSKGGDGQNWKRCSSGVCTWVRPSSDYPNGIFLQGKGGEAGGGGSGGWQRDGNDPHGGGGGGGRKLRKNGSSSRGEGGGSPNRRRFGGGNGGRNNEDGESVRAKNVTDSTPWGNGSGGGGWGADGGDQLTNARDGCQGYGPRKPKGGKGGNAIKSVNKNYNVFGGTIYGRRD